MFETQGKVNEEVLKSIKKYLLLPKYKITYGVLTIISIISALGFLSYDLLFSIIFICLALAFIWRYFHSLDIILKRNVGMIKETSGGDEVEYKISFNENGADINNLTTGGKAQMSYDLFTRLEETDDLYVLFTKSGQYLLIFKNCLESKEIDAFDTFIREKCTNLK